MIASCPRRKSAALTAFFPASCTVVGTYSPSLVPLANASLLDEPTAGVDVDLRKDMWALVGRLRQSGVTIILTTHYLEEAEEMCDEIAIINHGEKVAQDSTANLLGRIDAKTMVIHPASAVATLPGGKGMEVDRRPDGAMRGEAGQITALHALD